MLKRAHRARPLVDSLRLSTTVPHEIVFVCTVGDDEVIAACSAIEATHMSQVTVLTTPPNTVGDYAKKINLACSETWQPYLFLGADDLNFHPEWFEHAARMMASREKCMIVGTQDQANPRVIAGRHSTHSLVHRDYISQGTIDSPGIMLHEGYIHEFVDDEFVETAKARRAFLFSHRSIVEHLHPLVGKAPSDDMYAASEDRMKVDRELYRKRRYLWNRGR